MTKEEVAVLVRGWEKAILSMSEAATNANPISERSYPTAGTGVSRSEVKGMIQNLEKAAGSLEKIAGIFDVRRFPSHSDSNDAVKEEDAKQQKVPLREKIMLTLREASQYTGIGQHKLCEMADNEDCDFILWVGRKRLFKRKKLEEFIEKAFSI